MANSILRDKTKAFAKEIVFLCRRLRENKIEGVLINQLLKSGASISENEFIQIGSLLEGSIMPKNETEIICSNAFLYHYFKLNNDIDIEEYNKYLNQKIEIEIAGKKQEYKIVGINFSNS